MRKKLALFILILIALSFVASEAECNIVLKTLVVNPSKDKTQTAKLMAYLPKEATADDIVNIGDLNVDYDIEKGLYYVHQKYDLKPGESVAREIEIRDVWVISRSDIENLTKQAKDLAEKLKGTTYFDMAIALQKDIERKTDEILDRQEKALDAKPQTHIGVYRSNVNILDLTNNDLAKLEKMVEEVKEDNGPGDKIHVQATWRLIVAMIAALGVLSVVFFVIWNRQAAIEGSKKTRDSD